MWLIEQGSQDLPGGWPPVEGPVEPLAGGLCVEGAGLLAAGAVECVVGDVGGEGEGDDAVLVALDRLPAECGELVVPGALCVPPGWPSVTFGHVSDCVGGCPFGCANRGDLQQWAPSLIVYVS